MSLNNRGNFMKLAPLLMIAVISAAAVVVLAHGDKQNQSEISFSPEMSIQACSRDIACWSDMNKSDYKSACKEAIEKTSSHYHKWSGKTEDFESDDVKWLSYNDSTLTISGSNFEDLVDVGKFEDDKGKVAYQHGQGRFQKSSFECDYDPSTKSVIAVRVSPKK
ncbi:hypothetical protein ACA087_00850 [Pseudomonas chlororaphis]|uniref:hypothetical protein n=1 Tax=Pseudomonas chlororaphis TaxID=587753 RepID=UPI00352AA250